MVIADGATVTITTNQTCGSLQIGQGSSGVLEYHNSATARILTVNGDITVSAGAVFQANPSPTANGTHALSVSGNIINNGTIHFSQVSGAYTSTVNTTLAGSTAAGYSGSRTVLLNNLVQANSGGFSLNAGLILKGNFTINYAVIGQQSGTVEYPLAGMNSWSGTFSTHTWSYHSDGRLSRLVLANVSGFPIYNPNSGGGMMNNYFPESPQYYPISTSTVSVASPWTNLADIIQGGIEGYNDCIMEALTATPGIHPHHRRPSRLPSGTSMKRLAEGADTAAAYPEQSRYQAELAFYELAKDDSLLQADSLTGPYFAALDSGAVGALIRLRADFPQFILHYPDTMELLDTLIYMAHSGFPDSTSEADLIDSLLAAHQSRLDAYAAGLAAFAPENEVQEHIHDLLATLVQLEDTVHAARVAIAALLLDTIPDEEQALLLDSLALRMDELPLMQKEVLLSMAQECPFEKGFGVLAARSFFPDSAFANACETFIPPDARYAEAEQPALEHHFTTGAVKVYPNPSAGKFTVELPDTLKNVTFELYDVQGRLTIQHSIQQPVQVIEAAGLSPGLYLFRVQSRGEVIGKGLLMLDKDR